MTRRPKHRGAENHDWDARAQEVLDEARKMPHGAARTEALKKAGQLRLAADMRGLLTTKSSALLMPTADGDAEQDRHEQGG
jgi:hypothetical protein